MGSQASSEESQSWQVPNPAQFNSARDVITFCRDTFYQMLQMENTPLDRSTPMCQAFDQHVFDFAAENFESSRQLKIRPLRINGSDFYVGFSFRDKAGPVAGSPRPQSYGILAKTSDRVLGC
jgi:hypothetical protein